MRARRTQWTASDPLNGSRGNGAGIAGRDQLVTEPSKVLVVFGAGTGLGVSVARRFGREGYRVALVARRAERLEALAAELASEGVEAVAFPADLTDSAVIPALISAIRERMGRIDVVDYAPIGAEAHPVPAAGLTAESLRPVLDLLVLTPVEVIRAVLQELVERGDGAILVSHGSTAVVPRPYLSGLGVAMAANRNYLHSLDGELAGTGVYIGILTIGSVIAGSEGHQAVEAGGLLRDADGPGIPVVDPDELAERYWEMYTKRDRLETVIGGLGDPEHG
jgi:short-subunit dehydrogenase